MALVHRRLEILILTCRFLTRKLLGGRPCFLSVCRSGLLFGSRFCLYSIGTVKARTVSVNLSVHRVIDVGVMDNIRIHARHSGVVLEGVSTPSSTPVAVSGVAITVINASVKTDMRPPITLVKYVSAVVPTPPWRCPKQTHCWRSDPDAGYPIITSAAPTPVARSPHITCNRADWLLIYRQLGRSDVGRELYLGERRQW